MATDSPISLPEQAAELRQAVERLRRLRDAGGTVEALHRSAAEARVVTDAARPLTAGQSLLASELRVTLPAERLSIFRDQLGDVLTRAAADPDLLAQSGIDFAALRRLLDSTREALANAWKQHVNAPVEGEALAPVLERFAPLRPALEPFRQARAKLEPLAAQLPANAQTLARVNALRAELHAALQSVDAQGLEPEAVDFLRRCLDGYPLADLLARPSLLAWLKNQGLLDSLRVRPA
jgi:hypothetical protein